MSRLLEFVGKWEPFFAVIEEQQAAGEGGVNPQDEQQTALAMDQRAVFELEQVTQLTCVAPADVTRHLITGLTPGAGYTVQTAPVPGGIRVTLQAGGAQNADSGGVLLIGRGAAGGDALAYLPHIAP